MIDKRGVRIGCPFKFEKQGKFKQRVVLMMTDVVWKCEQVRGGQVWDKVVFDTKEEAEDFLRHMKQSAPDLFWRLEQIKAKMVWN